MPRPSHPRRGGRAMRGDSNQGPTQRQLRVGEMLRHALAEVLRENDIRDPDLDGVSVSTNQAGLVGRLSVPKSWTAAIQVANHSGAALPGGGWTGTALTESPAGVPGMPGFPAASNAGHHFGNAPRYGFRPTVMPRPPAAG